MVYTNLLRCSLLLMIMSSIHQPGRGDGGLCHSTLFYCLGALEELMVVANESQETECWANNSATTTTMRNFKWRICSLYCRAMLAQRLFRCIWRIHLFFAFPPQNLQFPSWRKCDTAGDYYFWAMAMKNLGRQDEPFELGCESKAPCNILYLQLWLVSWLET